MWVSVCVCFFPSLWFWKATNLKTHIHSLTHSLTSLDIIYVCILSTSLVNGFYCHYHCYCQCKMLEINRIRWYSMCVWVRLAVAVCFNHLTLTVFKQQAHHNQTHSYTQHKYWLVSSRMLPNLKSHPYIHVTFVRLFWASIYPYVH